MSMPNDFKHVNRKDGFYIANNIEKYGLSLDNAFQVLSTFEEIAKTFNVTIEKVVQIVKDMRIDNRHLFEYSTYKGNNNILIGEKLVYTEKQVRINNRYKCETMYYDVYLKEHTYISCYLVNIISRLFQELFPEISENNVFSTLCRRFPEELKGKINAYTNVRDLPSFDLSCQDIADLINKPEVIDEMVSKSLIHFYDAKSFFYLSLPKITLYGKEYEQSLQIPYEALMTKNWSLVENVKVFSIIKYDANEKLGADANNWFEGLQKDAPFFNHPMVNEFKKYFNK